MIADLVKNKDNYTFKVKDKQKVVFRGDIFRSEIAALNSFKRLNRSFKFGIISECKDTNCYHIIVSDWKNKPIAESENLQNFANVNDIIEKIKNNTIVLKIQDKERWQAYFDSIGDIQLKKSLTVKIEKTDEYLAVIDKLNLHAYGDDLDQTLSELKEDLEDLYNDLFSPNYKLAKPAIEMKAFLEKHII